MDVTLKNAHVPVSRAIQTEAENALEVEACERRQRLANLRMNLDKLAASLPAMDDSAPLIRRDRER